MFTFRFKILTSLSLMIIIASYVAFNFYQNSVAERVRRNSEESVRRILGILRNDMLYSLSDNGEKILYPMLNRLQKDENINATYVLDASGKIVMSTISDSALSGQAGFIDVSAVAEDITVNIRSDRADAGYLRAIMQIQNSGKCFSCHGDGSVNLGYVVLDYSLRNLKENIALIRQFGIVFTVLMLLIIIVGAIFMHYKSVRRSLQNFIKTIQKVEEGELSARVSIADYKELGSLGESFNRMLDQLQLMQNKLAEYHQK